MEAYEQLIDFLYEKGFEMNSKSPYESDTLASFESNASRLKNMNERQKAFNAIMHELSDLKKIINTKNTDSDLVPIIDNYYKTKISQIINNKVQFNNHHPLFGYKPFVDLLMVQYIKNEKFEECIKLKEGVLHQESYIS